MKRSHGFTIVELVIVTTVIAILATITTVAYLSHQTQAEAAKISSLADRIIANAEKYYDKNNEYPDGWAINSNPSGILDIPADELRYNATTFDEPSLTYCFNTTTNCSNGGIRRIYYARDPIDTTSLTHTNAGPCTIAFPGGANANGFSSFAIWYYDPKLGYWIYKKGSRGQVNISGTWCGFATN